MKKLITVLFIGFMAVSYGQTFKIDTKGASVSFNYVSEKTQGSISDVNAAVNLNYSDLSSSTVEGSAAVESLTTSNKTRDNHLKSADFFDADKYPTMKFKASSIYKDEDKYKAKGKLTIKDVTKEVTFTIKEEDGALLFKTVVYAQDYGVAVKKGDRAKSKIYVTVKVPTH